MAESNFDKNATSNSGAKGLMQLMDSTAQELAKELNIENFNSSMLYDPEINIMLGSKYFDKLLSKYNENYYLAIAAYNGGIGSVTGWKSNLKYDDTDEFVTQIPYEIFFRF